MNQRANDTSQKIVGEFGLDSLSCPVDLRSLAKKWGVSSIEEGPITSDAMLLPGNRGHSIVLRKVIGRGGQARQRFSLAHELGHLLLWKCGLSDLTSSQIKHRGTYDPQDQEEIACNAIAAEIIMPRLAFEEDGWLKGWSVSSLKSLSMKYQTSIEATARRMVDLMPETCAFGIWKPSQNAHDMPSLVKSYSPDSSCGVPAASIVSRGRLWLIARAANSEDAEIGIAPVINKKSSKPIPMNVPAEATAWGQAKYKQVMVYYYPQRELTPEMAAIAKVIG